MEISPRHETPKNVTLTIVSVVFFTFLCYLTIGIPLAVLPGFVHNSLGFNTVLAGLAVSVQYVATLSNRPQAGRMADAVGAKKSVISGLVACAISGISLPVAQWLHGMPWASLSSILVGRMILGFGESWVGTGAIVWAIGRVGAVNTARVISWNGITTYGAIAIGAPLGVWLSGSFGLAGMGYFMTGLAVVGVAMAVGRPGVDVIHGERMPMRHIFSRVTPFGLALGAGSVGFGVIASFITLYYASHHWERASLALTAFGILFVTIRLITTQYIGRFGGYRVGIVCLAVESLGLFLLAAAPNDLTALLGAAIAGGGFALVFPALGVEAVALVPDTSRGAALGIFNVFLDLSLAITGPLAGFLVRFVGYGGIYSVAGSIALGGMGLAVGLYVWARRQAGTLEASA